MTKATEYLSLIGTFSMAAVNIFGTFEIVKSVIIFLLTVVLFGIQFKIHLKRLKRENEKDKENSKKN